MLPAWTSSLGTAVVIQIVFPRYPLTNKFLSFPPASMYAQGRRKLLRGVQLFRETVPDSCLFTNRMKITKLSF